ncbi:hypothetical protein ABE37_09025 [Cytobacillus firmus]|nr:hypothetical protein [Cytobacillus firmus]
MFLRTPIFEEWWFKTFLSQLRQKRLHTYVIKPVSNRRLVFFTYFNYNYSVTKASGGKMKKLLKIILWIILLLGIAFLLFEVI